MKLIKLFILISFLMYNIDAQDYTNKIDEYTFGGNTDDNAVKINAFKNETDGKIEIQFIVDNKSYYRFFVEMSFEKLQNLSPHRYRVYESVEPGNTILAVYNVENLTLPFDYMYSYKFSFGIPSIIAEKDFPYLIPLQTEKQIQQQNISGKFAVKLYDTIVASRRGYIAGIPEQNLYKPFFENCIEIVHEDNTIATYLINSNYKLLVTSWDKVIPGQPLAIIKSDGYLRFRVYQFPEGNKYNEIDINYVLDNNHKGKYNDLVNIQVKHPVSIITKEFSKRELKKYKK